MRTANRGKSRLKQKESPKIEVLISNLEHSLKAKPPLKISSAIYPRGAVALIFRAMKNDVELLFIKRADRQADPWSGQMAFPGGRSDPGDKDSLQTAVREVLEETAIDLRFFKIIGPLDGLSGRTNRIAVTPYVVLLDRDIELMKSAEVSEVIWIPLSFFANPVMASVSLIRNGKPTKLGAVDYKGHIIWGMTLRIIEQFLERIGSENPPDRIRR